MRNDPPDDVVSTGLAPGEPLENLLPLWTEVFAQPAKVFTGVWGACPPERRHTFVARTAERPVASVQLYVLPLRDETGNPEWVGCVANVATLPEYRGRGLASELIKAAIAQMEAVGCGWSYLFTGVPEFYARQGWREYRRAMTELEPLPPTEDPTIRRLSPLDLPKIRSLFDRYLGQIPLSQVREEADWSLKIPDRFGDRAVLGIGEPLAGYASVILSEAQPILDEWAADSPEGYARLLDAARRLGPLQVTVPSPAALPAGTPATHYAGMARPVADRWTHERLEALLTSPQARFFSLDNF